MSKTAPKFFSNSRPLLVEELLGASFLSVGKGGTGPLLIVAGFNFGWLSPVAACTIVGDISDVSGVSALIFVSFDVGIMPSTISSFTDGDSLDGGTFDEIEGVTELIRGRFGVPRSSGLCSLFLVLELEVMRSGDPDLSAAKPDEFSVSLKMMLLPFLRLSIDLTCDSSRFGPPFDTALKTA